MLGTFNGMGMSVGPLIGSTIYAGTGYMGPFLVSAIVVFLQILMVMIFVQADVKCSDE